MPAVVNKLITKATTDLEKKKKKVLKVMDALIESREKEVFAAKDAITKMESVIEGLKDKNTDLIKKNQEDKKLSEQAINKVKKQSDEEIEKLQEGIRELNEQLKDHRKQKEDAENFFKKQREARIKKEMDGQSNINSPIQDPQAKIERLEKNLDDLEMELKIVRSDRDLIKRELEDKKNELAREKTFFNNEIKRQVELSQLALQNKENELARKETEREKNNNT
jgi:chromosome segregation ATPase